MSDLERALPIVLRYEGGYVHDPDDPGGATNKGITQSVYDSWRSAKGFPRQGVAKISDVEVRAIYEANYWRNGHCDLLPWPISLAHFDACVNTGIQQATKLLQRAAGVMDDGIWGPATAAVAPGVRLTSLLIERIEFYDRLIVQKPVLQKFFIGWIRRTLNIRKAK